MEALKGNLEEVEVGSSTESFRKLLDTQKELFHSQIGQLQRLVVTQCNLTGANPLSQEMAAGALSIKIGKRPRDLLNPKALKYMQEIFSIKDAISKKESREISALFGVRVTQVREFFCSQRTRVRKLVRLSREEASKVTILGESKDSEPKSHASLMTVNLLPLNSVSSSPGSLVSVSHDSLPLNSVSPSPPDLDYLNSIIANPIPLNSINHNTAPFNFVSSSPVPLNSIGPNMLPVNSICTSRAEEAPSCSTQDEALPGLDNLDKDFVQDIFGLLHREETFSGQVKLMEWILRIQNPSVLNWFLMKGGAMILATWLTEAADEEQTSVLVVALKVLCHLPLHKALPEHMSTILHSVNRLRFYRTSDISNRARSLLSRWSKTFARIQNMKKQSGVRSSTDAQDMILKQSIDEIMGKEIWMGNIGNYDDISALSSEGSEHVRKLETSQPLKLLLASTDDPSRKHVFGVSQSHARERRKVQLVEQPGQRTAGRSPQAVKAASVSQGRPLSADDIQKAKLRAQYMQSKYGKPGSSYNGNNSLKNEGSSKLPSTNSSAPRSPVRPKIEELDKPMPPPPIISSKLEEPIEPKIKVEPMVPLSEFCCRVQVPWQMPPEIKLNSLWRVGDGENSKEVDVQKIRNRRGIETIYRTLQEIPSNPRGPWDIEMDSDDTLTPEIPIEQPPDTDGADTQVSPNEHITTEAAPSAPALPQIAGVSGAEPDLELLAVLLKNPEVVFALTSGHAGNLTGEETVKLLDLIKNGGPGLSENLGEEAENKVEVSLPSPTPSSNPATSWGRQEVMKHPFTQQSSTGNSVTYPDSAAISVSSLTQYQHQATHFSIPQQQASGPSLSTQVSVAMPPFSLPQTNARTPEKPASSMVYTSNLSHPNNSSLLQQAQASEMVLSMKNLPISGRSLLDYSVSSGPSMQMENSNKIKPAAPSASYYTVGAAERRQVPYQLPTMMSTPTRSSFHQTHVNESPHEYTSRFQTGNVGPTPDSWIARKGLPSNSFSQVNQNNYGASYVGHQQPQLQSGPPPSGDDGFESWSPDNSPVRSSGYVHGGSYLEARINSGGSYMPDDRPRQQNSSGYSDNTRQAGRRWR